MTDRRARVIRHEDGRVRSIHWAWTPPRSLRLLIGGVRSARNGIRQANEIIRLQAALNAIEDDGDDFSAQIARAALKGEGLPHD